MKLYPTNLNFIKERMVRIACFPHKNRPLFFPASQLREFAANAAIMPIAISLLEEIERWEVHGLILSDFCAGSQDVMQSHEVS